MNKFAFPCGCSFDIIEGRSTKIGLPALDITLENMVFTCPEVWLMLAKGYTKGIWQLDSHLGKKWSKEVAPTSEEDLGAIGALMRPGCLHSISEGKSMTQHFADRKNGREQVKPYHPVIDECLKDTYNCLTYQEQSMRIAQKVAGFNLQEADVLRKAMGKKIASEMAKVREMFLQKAAEQDILTQEQREEVFGWIQSSQRYAFNKAHAIEYGMISFFTAYLKAHSILAFYTSWLRLSGDKMDQQKEVREIISEARNFNVSINCPDVRDGQPFFYVADSNTIRFGLCDIKDIGLSVIKKVVPIFNKYPTLDWTEFLIKFSKKVNKKALTALISAGAMDYMSVGRGTMQFELSKWALLTDREQEIVLYDGLYSDATISGANKLELYKKYKNNEIDEPDIKQYVESKLIPLYHPIDKTSLISILQNLINYPKLTNQRIQVIKSIIYSINNPPYNITDTPDRVASEEQKYLGIPISFHKIESCVSNKANCTCQEFAVGASGYMVIDVEVDAVKQIKIKKAGINFGKEMAFIDVSDATQQLPGLVIFPEAWSQYKHLLTKGNMLSINIERDKKRNSGIIKEVWQL